MATARSINNDAPAAQKEPWAWNHHDQCGFNGVPCRRWCAGWWSGCGWEKRGQRVSRGTEEEKPGGPPGHRRPTQQRAWLGCEQYRSSLFQSAFIRPPTHTHSNSLCSSVFSASLNSLYCFSGACPAPVPMAQADPSYYYWLPPFPAHESGKKRLWNAGWVE